MNEERREKKNKKEKEKTKEPKTTCLRLTHANAELLLRAEPILY